jgi:hypothetical protein
MVGREPWMCERLRDANTCGGIEAEHFLKEVKGCVGVVHCLELGCGRDKDVTLRISMRDEFFE